MMLAWIPFLQPIPELVSVWYLLCIPIVVGVSMVYKAIWIGEDDAWGVQTVTMSATVIAGLVGLAIAMAIFIQWVIPLL